MATPTFIAVNQTGSDIELVQLALTVPASGQVTISAFNTTSEIQDDAQLRSLINAGDILINDGTDLLTKDQSLQYASVVALPATPMLNAMTTHGDITFGGETPAGVPSRLQGVSGAYLRSKGTGDDPTFVRVLDVDALIADVTVGASMDASAIMQLNSTDKGLLLPRMTDAQMLAISTPATGLLVYNTDKLRSHFYDGTAWRSVASSTARVVTVATDGSADFESIQAALDSIHDAATDNRYIVEVLGGVYTENVTLVDFVSVNGTGWDTQIIGAVTADNPVEMTMMGMRVSSTNAPAIQMTNVTYPGELDLLGCFLEATWDATVHPAVIRCVCTCYGGTLYLYRECEAYLYVNDTVNTAGTTIQTIYHLLGTGQAWFESFNTYESIQTDNPGNAITCVYNTNTHADTRCLNIGYSTSYWLGGTAHANVLRLLWNSGGNGDLLSSRKDMTVEQGDIALASIRVACSEGAAASCICRVRDIAISKNSIADANVYIGSSTTATDRVACFSGQFRMAADVHPGRYTADGALGLFKYQVINIFGSADSSGLFNGAEVNADVTDWDNVSAALGGEAGVNANWIFLSDGAGGGTMGPNLVNISRSLTVGTGDTNYTGIKAAITAAVAGGCSAASPWEIIVHPGTYTEDPMTLVPGIVLRASDARMDTAFVVASTVDQDLFTCTGGYMSGLVVSGVTDAAKCLFRMATANTQTVFHGVRVGRCSNGWDVSGGASCLLTYCSTIITGPSQSITTWAKVSGSGSYLGCSNGFVACMSALLAYYADNPIQTVLRAADSASLLVSGASYRVAPKNSTADIVLADGGAQGTVLAAEIANSGNAVHIGSAGSDTSVTVTSVVFTNNLLNCFIESSTGHIFANYTTDIERKSIVTGGQQLGLIQYRDDGLWRLIGNGKYRFESGKDVDLHDFFYDFTSSGSCERGLVTAGTGLHVDVQAGEGFIRRGYPDEDAFSVTWSAVTALDLTASATNYVFYDSSDSTVKAAGSAPGLTGLLLATIVTDGSGIRFLHDTRFNLSAQQKRLNDYLLTTRTVMSNSGLSCTQGSTVRKFGVGSGSYYRALEIISYAGSGTDATWSYFYGTNGATEVASSTLLDITQYDAAGTLTAMTGGYFRKDTVYLTSDGRISVIYGTAQKVSANDAHALASRPAPTFMSATAMPIADIIVEEAVGIYEIVDIRPTSATTSGGGGGGSSSHSALADLDKPADHTWAMLVDGTRSMTGDLAMGTHNITGVGTVDGVTVSGHASRHNPGGSDALATAVPGAVAPGDTADAGSASSYSKSDHRHSIAAFGTGVGTFCQGNDSRLADDRTASGLRTSTTVVSISGATAPSVEQALVATSTTNATWQTVAVNGGNTLTAGLTLGTKDAYSLDLKTNNVSRFTITASGQITATLAADLSAGQALFLTGVISPTTIAANTDDYAPTGFASATVLRLTASGDYNITGLADGAAGRTIVVFNAGSSNNLILKNADSGSTASHRFLFRGAGDITLTPGKGVLLQYDGVSSRWRSVNVMDPYGTAVSTVCQGNDSRLSDDRAASGIRTATTLVSVSGATAPSNGQALVATSSTNATWQTITASAGGSNTQVQYNSSGTLAGAAKLTIDAGGNANLGDYTTTVPATPATGVTLFSKFRAGRCMAAQVGPSGLQYSMQPSLFAQKIAWWSAQGNSSSAASTYCFPASTTGNGASRTVTAGAFFSALRRIGYGTGTTAGNSAGVRCSQQMWLRGDAAGVGGFFLVIRFGMSVTQTDYRFFCGMVNTTSALTNQDPSLNTNIIGVGCDGTDANIYIMRNDGSGTATKTDTTLTKPTANTNFYEFRLYCKPYDTTVYWSLEILNGGSVVEGSFTTDLPSNTTMLAPQTWCNNNAQNANVSIDLSQIYVETDN
jgi:hypothetical protein